MMKARWHPIEWRSLYVRLVYCSCPGNPAATVARYKGLYNWVLLSYYSLWGFFFLTMTSKSSLHFTVQVSVYLTSSKPYKSAARPELMSGAVLELKDKEITDTVLNVNLNYL